MPSTLISKRKQSQTKKSVNFFCRVRLKLSKFLLRGSIPGVGKLRPAGRMRPSRAFCATREHFLKLCHLEINTTRGLTRRKSDDVLKKMVIACTLDGKCVRAYNCPQSGSYRLRKGEDLFFFLETPPILRAEIPHCQISQYCDLMQFLL